MNHLCESEIEELIKLVAKHKGDESPLLLVLARMLVEKKEENKNYIDHFLTAADYCDDMYEEEYAKVIRNTYVYPKNNQSGINRGAVKFKIAEGKENNIDQLFNKILRD